MSVVNMREWVKSAYPGDKWRKKVENMSDSQIVAVYYNLLRSGKINP